ncbi:MAG: hypothetical protein MI749_00160 [Desulfovibrionales bacterium]|nr:hypothetical protein [Desulfovibrionales bacterium]
MRVISRNVSAQNVEGFRNLGTSNEKVYLDRQGTLRAGKSWKGRLVSVLETLGIFTDYCVKTRCEIANANTHAGQVLWHALQTKYKVHNAREALAATSPALHGLDGLKVHAGLIKNERHIRRGMLTCGEITRLLQKAEYITARRARQMENLERQVPVQQHEAAYYDAADPHTAGLSDTVKNHQMVKDFVGKRENLLFILREMGVDASALNQPRVDYVMSKLLKQVDEVTRDGVFERTQIYRMAEAALKESLKHDAFWSRRQAISMGLKKRLGHGSNFAKDFSALRNKVHDAAQATVTPQYVQAIAHELAMPLKDAKARSIASHVIKEVEKTVKKDRIELGDDDFRRMVAEEVRKRVLKK